MGTAAGRITALAHATHLGPTLAVTGLATALALGAGLAPARSALLGAAALAGQLSVGWSNDWIDAERDVAVGRTDKPVVTGRVRATTLRTGALGAAAACVPLSLALGLRAGLLHLAAVGAAWAYNAGLKSTPLSWAPYAFAFGAMPSVVTLALPAPALAQSWATSAGALLGVGAHLANVLPDLDDDHSTGVRGLPHRLGRSTTALLAAAALLAATAAVVLGPPGPPSSGGWLALAGVGALAASGSVVALRRPASRFPFTASIAIAVVDVALLVLAGGTLAGSPLG